jgi:serine protease
MFQVDSGASVAASCTGSSSPLTCMASYATGSLAVGTHTITAIMAADANYSAASGMGTLTVNSAAAVLQTPSPGLSTILGTSNVQFSWSTGTGVTGYSFTLGTSGAGSTNLYSSGTTTKTTVTVPTIPASGVTVFATLGSLIGSTWQYANYVYTETGNSTPATLLPATGATLSANQSFSWSNGSGAAGYQLLVGSTGAGSSNLYYSGNTLKTSATVSIPANGAPVYATLLQEINGVWQSSAYTYTASGTLVLASLSPSSGGLSASQSFTWTGGNASTSYRLLLGTFGPGSSDIYSSGITAATGTPSPVSIPSNGVTVFATLYQNIGGVWQSTPYTLTEPGTLTPATLLPAGGATLSASQSFSWAGGTATNSYQLLVGTEGAGSGNLYYSGITTATSSPAISIPANGAPVYATLLQHFNGAWQSSAYTYTAPGTLLPATLTPASGATLAASQSFSWAGSNAATAYQLIVGTHGAGSSDLYSSGITTATSSPLIAIPSNGVNVYATLSQEISGVWQSANYVYTEPGTLTQATVVPASGALAASQTFNWNNGNAATYYQFLVGTNGPGTANLYYSGTTTSTTATVAIPANGKTVYVTLLQRVNGAWVSTPYTFTEP